jgi:hypothetical protein
MISLFSFLYRWYAETFPAAFEVSSDVGADLPLKFNQQKPLLSAQMKTPRTSRGRLLETTFSAFSLSLERCRFFLCQFQRFSEQVRHCGRRSNEGAIKNGADNSSQLR